MSENMQLHVNKMFHDSIKCRKTFKVQLPVWKCFKISEYTGKCSTTFVNDRQCFETARQCSKTSENVYKAVECQKLVHNALRCWRMFEV